jgi:hypothetical protein
MTVDDADKKDNSRQLYNQSSRYVLEAVSIHIVCYTSLHRQKVIVQMFIPAALDHASRCRGS